MKTLYLLRHAKSSWDTPGLADRDRPLNRRGQRALQLMASAGILDQDQPFVIFTSPAKRARDTIEGIAAASRGSNRIHVAEPLYTFAAGELLHWLKQQDDAQAALMIVGHNPALADLIAWLSGREAEDFPTCAFAELALATDSWAGIAPGWATLVKYLEPAWVSYEEFLRKHPLEDAEPAAASLYLQQIAALTPPALAGLDDEFLHKFRVTTRKLKTWLKARPRGPGMKARLKALKPLLRNGLKLSNPIRDLDVMLQHLPAWRKKLLAEDAAAMESLEGLLRQRRASAHAQFRQYVESAEYRQLFMQAVQLCEQLEAGRGVAVAVPRSRPPGFKKLARAHGRLTLHSDDKAIHKFRIKVKHFRYRLQQAHKHDMELVKQLEHLQDLLGRYNDCSFQQACLGAIAAEVPGEPLEELCNRMVKLLEKEKLSVKRKIIRSRLFHDA